MSFFSHLKTSVQGLYQISYCSKSYLKMRSISMSLKGLLFALGIEFWKHSTLGNWTMNSYCRLNSQWQVSGCNRIRALRPQPGSRYGGARSGNRTNRTNTSFESSLRLKKKTFNLVHFQIVLLALKILLVDFLTRIIEVTRDRR